MATTARKKHSSKPLRRKPKSASSAIIVRPARYRELDNDEITILKNTIAKGASDEELKFCLTVAGRYRLDPFKQQIWFVPRWDSNADNGDGTKGRNVYTPTVGIHGKMHCAARDHKDYGSVSLPEYGPMQDVEYTYTYNNKVVTKKIRAPEWAKVKVWKKGVAEPTEAIAYWDEYCPANLDKAPFWKKMPRRMIGKCAISLAIGEAYPDLGGLKIPEELDRMREDTTPSGRRIVYADEGHALPPLDENAAHGYPAGTSKAQMAENALARVEEEDRRLAEERAAEAAKAPPAKPAQAPAPPQKPVETVAGTVELDHTDPHDIVIRGDIGELLDLFHEKVNLQWRDEWWHVAPKDVPTIRTICLQRNYEIRDFHPSQGSAAKEQAEKKPQRQGGSAAGTSAKPPVAEFTEVTGTIERVQLGQTQNKQAMAQVTFTVDKKKATYGCFDKDLIDFLTKGQGKQCRFIVQARGNWLNITGLKSIGATTFEDGKIPTIERNREAGGKTLF